MNYILASKSPRRKELMNKISSLFSIETDSIDESKYVTNDPIETVKNISFHKGQNIAAKHPNDVVISADTIVVLDNKIFGKPLDENNAYFILKSLSGKTHQVITGYSVFYKGKCIKNHEVTDVCFNELSDQLIWSYIATKSPLDKAGAYGIQDNENYPIIKKIIGSFENVVGFPTNEIINDINRLTDNQ